MENERAKRALIVDDSKSARAFLARILDKYEIEVDTAESAEQAIEFLRTGRPDVIFMDHLMPGMDGFQAVQLIKNNPRTATIPIMMYTSQEGELYVGQARALGAIGVLPKQIQPADVSKVLYQLKLIRDRRSDQQLTFTPANPEVTGAVGAAANSPAIVAGAPAAGAVAAAASPHLPAAPELRAMVDSVVRERVSDLRRELAVHLDDQHTRLLSDIRATMHELVPAPAPRAEAAPQDRPAQPWGWLAATLGLGLAFIALTILFLREVDARRQATAELARIGALMDTMAARVEAGQRAAAAAQAALAESMGVGAMSLAPGGVALAAASSDPALVAREPVPYGEIPLAGSRIPPLRAALMKLVGDRYAGIVQVRTYPGSFCLVGNATEGYSLAPDDLAYARCDVVGNPAYDGLEPSQRESLGFANLVAESRRMTSGALKVRVLSGSPADTLVAYPSIDDRLTAGDWNKAGVVNNRIEVRTAATR